jgi:hypothetical protein
MSTKFDAHLPYPLVERLSGMSHQSPEYTPPPSSFKDRSLAFLLACNPCCYANTLAHHHAVLQYKTARGEVGFAWQESLQYTLSQRDDSEALQTVVLKVLLMGSHGVGKTSLFFRLLNDGFPDLDKGGNEKSKEAEKAKKAKKKRGAGAMAVADKTNNLGTRMIHSSETNSPLFLEFWDVPSDSNSNNAESVGSGMALDGIVDCVVLVYDVRNKETLNQASAAFSELVLRFAEDNVAMPHVVLLGNFEDQGSCKFQKELDSFQRKHHKAVTMMTASARSSVGLLEVTQQLVGLVVDKAKKGKEAGGGPQPEAMER